MKDYICNIDVIKTTGMRASAAVRFPSGLRETSMLNWLLLTHDSASQHFAAAHEAQRLSSREAA